MIARIKARSPVSAIAWAIVERAEKERIEREKRRKGKRPKK